MYSELRSQRTAQEFFAGVLTKPMEARHAKISDVKNSANLVAGIRRSSRKGRFLDTFCRPGQKVSIMQSSRRNPAEQHARAFFGYFLSTRTKSINNASETEACKTTHKVSERQNFAITNSTPPLELRRPERTMGQPEHRCSANITRNGQAREFFAGVLMQPIGSTSHKNQRREKFCESSRRNPA